MASRGHCIYYFRATFPDGDHILTHNSAYWPNANGEIPQIVYDNINEAVGQNPDVQVIPNTIKVMRNWNELQADVDKLRAEDPNRPLANDLGLDKTNRLLTNPEVSRNIAAARGVAKEPEA